MKTIVLFFVLFAAFAAVTAKHSKKHKTQESSNGAEDTSTQDWPRPESIGEYGIPEGYDGPGTGGGQNPGGPGATGGQNPEGPGGQAPGGNNDLPSGKSRVRSRRRHN